MNKQIKYHLARLPRHFKPNLQDEEDLRQEIICDILLREVDYDSKKSSVATYRDRIIRKHLEGFKSNKRWRKHQTPESIHDIEEKDEPVTNDVSSHDLENAQNRVFASEMRNVITQGVDREQDPTAEPFRRDRKAIATSIKNANKELEQGDKIQHWTPYQLRHAAATELSETSGLDVARAVLGQKTINVTQMYNHADKKIAMEAAKKRSKRLNTG